MRTPSARTRKILTATVIPLSIIAAGASVWHSSYAAFTAETRNSGNAWSTGRLTISDDDAGSARFTVADLVPDQTETKCIKVTANTTVGGHVKFYVINPVTTALALEDHIDLTVDEGTGGDFASCTGFVSEDVVHPAAPLSGLMTDHGTYANGLGSWTPSGSASDQVKTYRISWTFNATGMTENELNALQGSHTGVDFEWEIQNTN